MVMGVDDGIGEYRRTMKVGLIAVVMLMVLVHMMLMMGW